MTGAGLVHRALIYGAEEEFLGTAVPFLQEGLEADDFILAVIPPNNIDLVSDMLGSDRKAIKFLNSIAFYEHPVRTISAYNDMVQDHAPRRIRALAEPTWRNRSPMEVREWGRYEAVVNAAFGTSGAHVVCPYDRRLVSPKVIESAERTHPEVMEGAYSPVESLDYSSPASFSADCDREPLSEPPLSADRMIIESPDLAGLRAFVTERALRRGMTPGKLTNLLIAVNEIGTNAVKHGTPPIELLVWGEAGSLICEVADIGLWHPGDLAGFLPPATASSSGFGLWGARMLADLIQIRGGYEGTRVRLRMNLS